VAPDHEIGWLPSGEIAWLPSLKFCIYETDGDLAPYLSLHALPSAHFIEIDLRRPVVGDRLSPRRYYDLSQAVADQAERLKGCASGRVLEEVEGLFADAVKIRVRADVPIGVALSGGLDSSTIASHVKDLDAGAKAYCFGAPNKSYTEGPLVDRFAAGRGINVEYVWPLGSTIAEDLKSTIRTQGAPFTSASIIGQNMVYRRARADGVTVLMGGQAGDEVFMGYRKYHLFKMKELAHQRRVGALLSSLVGVSKMLISEGSRLIDYGQHCYRYKKVPRESQTIFHGKLLDPIAIGFHPLRETLRQRQVRDVTQISLPTLLRYEDRNSLGNGVESRLPFLDYRLVELGLAIADNLKMKDGFGKWVIRQIGRGRVPDEIRTARYKSGFDVSMDALCDLGFGRVVRDEIRESSPSYREYVKGTDRLVKRFSDHSLKNNKRVFAEAMTLLWLNHYSSRLRGRKPADRGALESATPGPRQARWKEERVTLQ